jgi:hypothetical protein
VFIIKCLSAFLEDLIAIGKNGLAIMEKRAISIQTPVFLAKKL